VVSAGIIAREKLREISQHRFDAAFLVVSRDEKQQAGVRHADLVAKIRGNAITEGFRPEIETRFFIHRGKKREAGHYSGLPMRTDTTNKHLKQTEHLNSETRLACPDFPACHHLWLQGLTGLCL